MVLMKNATDHRYALTLITPTGDRQDSFALCERWIRNQAFNLDQVQWIVVDDGVKSTQTTMGQTYLRRTPKDCEPSHTLPLNLWEALPHIQSKRVMVIEDDDYYGPTYLETMMQWLNNADLVGEVGAKYYHLRYGFRRFKKHNHASLCRTGFTDKVLAVFSQVVEQCIETKSASVDLKLWSQWGGSKFGFVDPSGDARLCVGIKGGPGRRSPLHKKRHRYTCDTDLKTLKHWVGEDWIVYARLAGHKTSAPIVVYTAIFDNYDLLRERPLQDIHARYVCFTDRPTQSKSWEIIQCSPTESTPSRENRKYKLQPFLLFPHAEWVLYIDGSMRLKKPAIDTIKSLINHSGRSAELFCFMHRFPHNAYREARRVINKKRDSKFIVNKQIDRYRSRGMPKDQPTGECGFLLSRNNRDVKDFYKEWWHEVCNHSVRDQISFSYVLWKMSIDVCLISHGLRKQYVSLHNHGKKPSSAQDQCSDWLARIKPLEEFQGKDNVLLSRNFIRDRLVRTRQERRLLLNRSGQSTAWEADA